MLALEPSRKQQLPYFQSYPIDPAMTDPFAFPMHQPGFAAPAQGSGPHSYYDPPMYASGPHTKTTTYTSMPTISPPEVNAQLSEPVMPGLSSASGPSIASASSSATGSPYPVNAQAFQESWVDTNHGLGLQATVVGDLFPNEYVNATADTDTYFKKSQDSFVGKSASVKSINH